MVRLSTIVKDTGMVVTIASIFAAAGIAIASYTPSHQKGEDKTSDWVYVFAGTIAAAGIIGGAAGIKLGYAIETQEDLNQNSESGNIFGHVKKSPIKYNPGTAQKIISTPYTRTESRGIKYH